MRNYSIHFHVWTQVEIFELLLLLRERFDATFDIEIAVRNEHENIFVLRKSSPSPPRSRPQSHELRPLARGVEWAPRTCRTPSDVP